MGKRSFVFVFIITIFFVSIISFLLFKEKSEVFSEEIFLRVSGRDVIDSNNNHIYLKGLSLPNGVYNVQYPYRLFGSEYELTDDDYSRIASIGFNSVRFYIQYHWLSELDEFDFFQYLDSQIELAKKYNIYIILNLHYFGEAKQVKRGAEDGFYKGNPKYNLVRFWKKISDRYKNEPIIGAYDLINEPKTSKRMNEKNLYAKYNELIKAIRDNDDNHILIVSEPVNKFSDALKDDIRKEEPFIKLEDKNLMYQFHWYEPIEFTHQGFFETDYFELGAEYPTEKRFDTYKGGYYRSPYISDTKGNWVEYKTPWINLNLSNCEIDTGTDRFNLSLSFSGSKGKVWFDDIILLKRDSNGNITNLNVPNYDIRESRAFVGWTKNPKPSYLPKRWNPLNDPKTKGIVYSVDWENDHTGNGSGSLFADCTNAKWGDDNPWAVWGQSGGAVSTYYSIDKDAEYQARFWVKTENNPEYCVSVGFGIYNLKEILINRFTIQNIIHEYYTKWALKHNVPLYCGEFGTTNPGLLYDSFISDQQAKWVEDMLEILNQEVGHWAYHSYKSYSPRSDLFGLFNNKKDKRIIKVISKNITIRD